MHLLFYKMKRILILFVIILFHFGAKAQFDTFIIGDSCEGNMIVFSTDVVSQPVDSAFWNFGDPLSGTNDTTSVFLPFHVFSDTGLFVVTLKKWVGAVLTEVTDTIKIYPQPTLNLGADTTLCFGNTVTYDLSQPYAQFLWQDASTNPIFTVSQDSILIVKVSGVCDTLIDTVAVNFDMPFTFNLGPDTSYCQGDTITLDANINVPASFAWNTGQFVDSISITTSNQYIFTALNVCDTIVDTLNVVFLPVPNANLLPADTVNCLDQSIILVRPQNDSISYVWSDSTSTLTYQVDSTETVWLAAINACGTAIDTFNAVFNGEIITDLGDDTTICYLDSILLIATTPSIGAVYLWNTGETSDTIFTDDVDKLYSVTVTAGACSKVSSIRVQLNELACPSIDCIVTYDNVFSPNQDGLNDIWRIKSDCDIYEYDLRVYDRWGQQVHFSDNIAYGWDGYVNGQYAATGTYFFVMEFRDGVVVNVDRQVFRGSITLTR